jgi:hypothetical protein
MLLIKAELDNGQWNGLRHEANCSDLRADGREGACQRKRNKSRDDGDKTISTEALDDGESVEKWSWLPDA